MSLPFLSLSKPFFSPYLSKVKKKKIRKQLLFTLSQRMEGFFFTLHLGKPESGPYDSMVSYSCGTNEAVNEQRKSEKKFTKPESRDL